MIHEKLQELLPWYANGTLTASDLLQVEEHLKACSGCRLELAELHILRAEEKEVSNLMPAPSSGLRLVSARIDEYESSGKGRISWKSFTAWFSGAPIAARYVMAAQLGLILLMAGIRGTYTSDFTTQAGPSSAHLHIAVKFQPTVSESNIRPLLQQAQARIVDGPSAAGLYTLSYPILANDLGKAEDALKALRSHPNVVLFAERKLP